MYFYSLRIKPKHAVLPTRSKFGDGTQQVVVDDWRGVLRLLPADWRGGRWGDQELLIWLGRLQARTPYVDGLRENDRCQGWQRLSIKRDAITSPVGSFECTRLEMMEP